MRGPFEHAAFRRLLAGRVVTNVGDSLYFVAAMWLVYRLTGNPLYSGVAGFLTLAPSALQFLVGPLVDRWSLRRTLVGTQAVQAVVVAVVPVAHALGALRPGLVLVVMPTLAALNQLVYPAQTAALPRLLDEEDLVAANSAFSAAYQGVDMVANGVGGVLVGLLGAVALFAVDAGTFVVAAALFATVAVPPAAGASAGASAAADGGTPAPESYLCRLHDGAALLRGTVLVPLLAGTAAVNFASGMALAAMPAYADAVGPASGLVTDAGAYGVLMAAIAAGTLLGAVGASAVSDSPLGRTMTVGFAASGVLWAGAVAADWLPVTAGLFALALVPVGVVNVQIATVVQTAPPEEYVGRVSSLLGSASAAALPVGALAGGAVAADVSPRAAVAVLGVGTLALAGYVLLVPALRRLPAAGGITLDRTEG